VGQPLAAGIPAGVCPFAQAWLARLENEPAEDIAIFVTVCDQMRRAAEVAEEANRSVFLMHVPATWQTASAQRFYRDELERLGRFLTRHGGQSPTRDETIETFEQFDTARATLRGLGGVLPSAQFSERIALFQEQGRPEIEIPRNNLLSGGSKSPGPRIGLVGVPLMPEDRVLFGLFEQAGGEVVFDGTESGEAGLPAPFNRRRLREDPLGELVEAYFGQIPEIARRPNSEFYVWLRNRIEAYGLRGLVVLRRSWCDLWHAEVERIREWAPVPVFDLDLGSGLTVGAERRLTTRIEAFVGTLS
jgi:benzoyl-CoA reductase/2-hydroxyglutaryl-CoA dehydratase subunit BcrC/BadD/HgdB